MTEPRDLPNRAPTSSTTAWVPVLLAWLVVAAPLGWGLYQSVIKSRPLFQGSGSVR